MYRFCKVLSSTLAKYNCLAIPPAGADLPPEFREGTPLFGERRGPEFLYGSGSSYPQAADWLPWLALGGAGGAWLYPAPGAGRPTGGRGLLPNRLSRKLDMETTLVSDVRSASVGCCILKSPKDHGSFEEYIRRRLYIEVRLNGGFQYM